MNLKKLYKQAYPEESGASGILLQHFLMGLKTSISRQLLLRGKPDNLEKAIVAAMEIESVFAIESNPAFHSMQIPVYAKQRSDVRYVASKLQWIQILANVQLVPNLLPFTILAGPLKFKGQNHLICPTSLHRKQQDLPLLCQWSLLA